VPGDELLEFFLELIRVPSAPGHERAAVDLCGRFLDDLGLAWDEDGAAAALEGNAGNLYCRIPPAGGASGTPLFFCAHLDTVPHEGPIEPVVEDGVVRSAGDTILGADNKATVAAVLDAVREIVRSGAPHAGIELVLTPQEEIGLRGAKAFDHDRLVARMGYVFDHAAPIGGMVLEGPTQYSVDATFRGREAHAGIAPEEGRSAITAAARAIAEMRLGRIDDETTSNVGLISGGSARNVVAGSCQIVGEARSLDPKKALRQLQAMVDAIAHAADAEGCEVETRTIHEYEAYRLRRADPVVALAEQALVDCGYTPAPLRTGGGADSHVFNARGRPCLNLPNGMTAIHTSSEHISVDDLEGISRIVRALVSHAHVRETASND
jgi:tripeptide aminopeptidase